MRRHQILLKIVIIFLLLSLATWNALPFRSLSLARQSVLTFSWDAASHTLIALDLADSIRILDPVQWLGVIFAEHWWPPLYGIVLSPFFLLFG